MPKYTCDYCGKPYKSLSGLKAHRKTHAGQDITQPRYDVILGGTPEPGLGEGENYLGPSPSDHLNLDDIELLAEACAALDIEPADVLSSKVYPDRVVIIAGPTGKKLFWTREV